METAVRSEVSATRKGNSLGEMYSPHRTGTGPASQILATDLCNRIVCSS